MKLAENNKFYFFTLLSIRATTKNWNVSLKINIQQQIHDFVSKLANLYSNQIFALKTFICGVLQIFKS